MAASINIPVYSDALVVLGTAGIIVPLAKRWGLNSVLGYFAAGALLGPLGLGTFVSEGVAPPDVENERQALLVLSL
jgi:CPA2 family monovalent cation:H+ antiporter-2